MTLLRRVGDGSASTLGDWVGAGANRMRGWMGTREQPAGGDAESAEGADGGVNGR